MVSPCPVQLGLDLTGVEEGIKKSLGSGRHRKAGVRWILCTWMEWY